VLGLGKVDGSSWRFYGRQFDFCDVQGTWAIRDGTGKLHWYAVGNNQFANGVRVWKFDESTQSFGGRTNTVFAEGNGIDIGSATGVWGSAADDAYVIGELAAVSGGVRRDGYITLMAARGRALRSLAKLRLPAACMAHHAMTLGFVDRRTVAPFEEVLRDQ